MPRVRKPEPAPAPDTEPSDERTSHGPACRVVAQRAPADRVSQKEHPLPTHDDSLNHRNGGRPVRRDAPHAPPVLDRHPSLLQHERLHLLPRRRRTDERRHVPHLRVHEAHALAVGRSRALAADRGIADSAHRSPAARRPCLRADLPDRSPRHESAWSDLRIDITCGNRGWPTLVRWNLIRPGDQAGNGRPRCECRRASRDRPARLAQLTHPRGDVDTPPCHRRS